MEELNAPGVEAAPEAPAAPEVPAPEAPAAPEAPGTPTPDEQAAEAEAKEWDDAAYEIFPGLKKTGKKEPEKPKEEDKPDEPAKPKEEPKKEETPPANPADKKPEPPKGAGDGAEDKGDEGDGEDEIPEFDTSALDARVTARQQQQQSNAVKSDIRKQMFADVPSELRDADGDPIKTIDDVVKLQNPRTGKAFTDEEAGMWLLSAQQQFNQNLANVDKQIDSIAEVNLDLKDQADMVNYKYGALLKAMPELRDKLWSRYQNTLVKDGKSGIITKAPVSLEEFYETALEPYAVMGRDAEAKETKAAADKAAADKAAADAEAAKKQQTRQDRSDIYGGGKVDDRTEEDKEWADAATAVFGPKK